MRVAPAGWSCRLYNMSTYKWLVKRRERERSWEGARVLYLPSQLERRRSHAFFLPPDWLAADVSLHHIPPFALGCLLALFWGWMASIPLSPPSAYIFYWYVSISAPLSLSEKIWVFHSAILGWSRPADRRVHHTFFSLLNFNCIFLFFVAFRRVLAIQIKWHVDRIDFFVLLVVKD